MKTDTYHWHWILNKAQWVRCPSLEGIRLSALTACEVNHSLGAYVLDEVCNDSYILHLYHG